NTFFALMTGLAAGAVLGVLFAPESGEKSREKLKKAVKSRLDDWEEACQKEEENEECEENQENDGE
ncbi:MAG: YtxH domain-containing protein, partial [Bacteroidales bacterium]|nr:YtxH domain-containing protein [Bacteroidales bacterium]